MSNEVQVPPVGSIVLYRSALSPNPVPALVVGEADEPEARKRSVNLLIFQNGPRPPKFGRNVAFASKETNTTDTWHHLV